MNRDNDMHTEPFISWLIVCAVFIGITGYLIYEYLGESNQVLALSGEVDG